MLLPVVNKRRGLVVKEMVNGGEWQVQSGWVPGFVALVSQSGVLSKLSRTKNQDVLLHPVYLVLYYSYSQTMKQY